MTEELDESPALPQLGEQTGAAPVSSEFDDAAEIDKIVGTISDGAVYGKFPHGTTVQIGNLPKFTISFDRDVDSDFDFYPPSSVLTTTRERLVEPFDASIFKKMGNDLRFNPPHYIVVAPLNGRISDGSPDDRAIVDLYVWH